MTLTYPVEGFRPPKDRTGHATGKTGLPAGTQVFSADNRISLAVKTVAPDGRCRELRVQNRYV